MLHAARRRRRRQSPPVNLRNRDVQITLRILRALIDKAGRDLPLFATSVLKILDAVIRSGDLTTAEESTPTFESFCEHHEGSSLAAIQDYGTPFTAVVVAYAGLTQDYTNFSKEKFSMPVAQRWRTIGLRAINCLASSELLGTDEAGYLDAIMPVLLDALQPRSAGYLKTLHRRVVSEDHPEEERPITRRLSLATVRTAETSDSHPAPFLPTVAEADKVAEEKIGLMSLQSLKGIFQTSNRNQVRTATALVLNYALERVTRPRDGHAGDAGTASRSGDSWAAALVEMMARWVPVQDRYVIVVSALELLAQMPLTDRELPRQLVLASLIGSLLRSDVNLIGLGVIDILVDILRRILALLELGPAGPAATQPAPSERGGASSRASQGQLHLQLPDTEKRQVGGPGESASISNTRDRLLHRLRSCIGDLATHVYYLDQISDMISAILVRLKPSPTAMPSSLALASDDRTTDDQQSPGCGTPLGKLKANEVFWTGTARAIALKAVTDILQVANLTEMFNRTGTSSRNRVSLEVWEGTHWLIRDRDGLVRKAYVEALSAWLRWEIDRSSARALMEQRGTVKATLRHAKELSGPAGPSQSVRSSILKRHTLRPAKLRFLPLLHVSIYDNLLDNAESGPEMMLMHLLLTNLAEKLSVVAVKYGLPMAFRLQDDAQNFESRLARVRVGSLVHGYLWMLCEQMGLAASWIGRDVSSEISRRKSLGIWTEGIQTPPIQLESIRNACGSVAHERGLLQQAVRASPSRPFEHRAALIELIGMAYAASLTSPPGSPAGSPSCKQTLPILETATATRSAAASLAPGGLPPEIKNEMGLDWSRESVIASCQAAASKSASGSESRRGALHQSTSGRDVIGMAGMNGGIVGGIGSGIGRSPSNHHLSQANHLSSSPLPPATGGDVSLGVGGVGMLRRAQQVTLPENEGTSTPLSVSSSRSSVVRVDDLKRVLSGNMPGLGGTGGGTGAGRRRDAVSSGQYGRRGGSWRGSSIGERSSSEESLVMSSQSRTSKLAMLGVATTDFAQPEPMDQDVRARDDYPLRWGRSQDHALGRAPAAEMDQDTRQPLTAPDHPAVGGTASTASGAARPDEPPSQVTHLQDPSTASTMIPSIPRLPASVLSGRHSSSSAGSLPIQGVSSTSHPGSRQSSQPMAHQINLAHADTQDQHSRHVQQPQHGEHQPGHVDHASGPAQQSYRSPTDEPDQEDATTTSRRQSTSSQVCRRGRRSTTSTTSNSEDLNHLLDQIPLPPLPAVIQANTVAENPESFTARFSIHNVDCANEEHRRPLGGNFGTDLGRGDLMSKPTIHGAQDGDGGGVGSVSRDGGNTAFWQPTSQSASQFSPPSSPLHPSIIPSSSSPTLSRDTPGVPQPCASDASGAPAEPGVQGVALGGEGTEGDGAGQSDGRGEGRMMVPPY